MEINNTFPSVPRNPRNVSTYLVHFCCPARLLCNSLPNGPTNSTTTTTPSQHSDGRARIKTEQQEIERTRGPYTALVLISVVFSFAQTSYHPRGSYFFSLSATPGGAVFLSQRASAQPHETATKQKNEETWRRTPLSRGLGCSTYQGVPCMCFASHFLLLGGIEYISCIPKDSCGGGKVRICVLQQFCSSTRTKRPVLFFCRRDKSEKKRTRR